MGAHVVGWSFSNVSGHAHHVAASIPFSLAMSNSPNHTLTNQVSSDPHHLQAFHNCTISRDKGHHLELTVCH